METAQITATRRAAYAAEALQAAQAAGANLPQEQIAAPQPSAYDQHNYFGQRANLTNNPMLTPAPTHTQSFSQFRLPLQRHLVLDVFGGPDPLEAAITKDFFCELLKKGVLIPITLALSTLQDVCLKHGEQQPQTSGK
jgi:hypothetical protein